MLFSYVFVEKLRKNAAPTVSMVSTRRKRDAGTSSMAAALENAEDKGPGSIWWFRVHEGLNGCGVIPGTNLDNRHCSRAEYVSFWGEKNYHNGGRYKRRVSPRMVRRIRHLYQRCFQKPVGAADAIPYHFGRGLLAERNGHPVNWAAYARKMTHRGTGDTAHLGPTQGPPIELRRKGEPFVFLSMEDLRKITRPENWPKNEAGVETDDEEGSDSDWDVNVIYEQDEEGDEKLLRDIVNAEQGGELEVTQKCDEVPSPEEHVDSGNRTLNPGALFDF